MIKYELKLHPPIINIKVRNQSNSLFFLHKPYQRHLRHCQDYGISSFSPLQPTASAFYLTPRLLYFSSPLVNNQYGWTQETSLTGFDKRTEPPDFPSSRFTREVKNSQALHSTICTVPPPSIDFWDFVIQFCLFFHFHGVQNFH